MSKIGSQFRLRHQFRAVLEQKEGEPTRFRAVQGDGAGTVKVPNKPNYIYIRRVGRSRFEECLNVRTPARYDLPVVVGYLHELPGILQVLDIDWVEILGPGDYPYVPGHHESHELHNDEGGDDVVWVQSQQILPLLVYPTRPTSMSVGVFGGWYPWDNGWHYFEGTTSADLTGYIPPGAGDARFLLICIDGATKALHYSSGSIFPRFLPPLNYEDRIPSPPPGKIPLAAIYFVSGIAQIDWGAIYDLRLSNQPVGGSIVPGPHSLLDSVVHDDTLTNSPSLGSLIYGVTGTYGGVTGTFWSELVHPGAAGYALVSEAAGLAWSLAPTWLGEHSFEAGAAVSAGQAIAMGVGATIDGIDLSRMGDMLFSAADGLLLLGPNCKINDSEWWSLRRQKATITGAFHQEAGRWLGTRGLMVEAWGTNKVKNPTFGGSVLTSWSAIPAATISAETDYPYICDACMKIVAPTDYDGARTTFTLVPATTYHLSLYMRSDSDVSVTVQLRDEDAAGDIKREVKSLVAGQGWKLYEYSFTTHAVNTHYSLQLWAALGHSGTWYVDAVQIEQRGYRTSITSGDLAWCTWVGAAHASDSSRTATTVSIPTDGTLEIANGSFAFWIHLDGEPDVYRSYLSHADAGNNNRYQFYYDQIQNKYYFRTANNAGNLTMIGTQAALGDGWHHIVCTWDVASTTMKLYIDGALDASSTSANLPSVLQATLHIGSWKGTVQWSEAGFGEFATFGKALSAVEVAAIYALQRPLVDAGATDNPVLIGEVYTQKIHFSGVADANSIIIPDGLASALNVIDTGDTEFLRLNTTSNCLLIDPGAVGIKVGIGITIPQGLLQGYDTIGGFLYWEYDNLDATWRTIIPNGVGDVIVRAEWLFVISSAAGSVGQHLTVANGSNVTYTIGAADTVKWEVQADGTFRVQRSGGTNPVDLAMWIVWL